MKIKLDKTKCYGCGTCVALMPEVFEIGDDGLAKVKDEYLDKDISDSDALGRLKTVAASCPNGAISLE